MLSNSWDKPQQLCVFILTKNKPNQSVTCVLFNLISWQPVMFKCDDKIIFLIIELRNNSGWHSTYLIHVTFSLPHHE